MKTEIKQIYISIRLRLNGRHAQRNEAFLEWKRWVTAARLTDNVIAVSA